MEIQETEAKYYKTLEDIEKVSVALCVCAPYSVCALTFECVCRDVCALLSWQRQCGVGAPFCHLFFVGVSGLRAGSQHGNVSYWQIHWWAQMGKAGL